MDIRIALANAVLAIHWLIVWFIVGGLVATWVGAWQSWAWVRNRVFRQAHLAAIAFVALISMLGAACPLTVLEDWLRRDTVNPQGFIQRWADRLLYYDLPMWMFTVAYVAFALLVLLTWRHVPPARSVRPSGTPRQKR